MADAVNSTTTLCTVIDFATKQPTSAVHSRPPADLADLATVDYSGLSEAALLDLAAQLDAGWCALVDAGRHKAAAAVSDRVSEIYEAIERHPCRTARGLRAKILLAFTGSINPVDEEQHQRLADVMDDLNAVCAAAASS